MSRIYGIVSPNAALLREPRDASAFAPGLAVESGTLAGTGFRFGWKGARAPRLYEDDRCLVLCDGNLFAFDGPSPERTLGEAALRGSLAEVLAKINGDFALAVLDKGKNELWLARDRFGVKPLYFAHSGASFAFSSLPRAAAAALGRAAAPRREYVARYLAAHYRYFDNDPEHSPYEGVFQVAPAQLVHLTAGGAKRSAWWSLREQGNLDISEADLAERYRALLADAVKIRLAARDGVAFTLSGGMDSSSVMATSVKLLGRKQVAYSSVYEDKTYDESDEIRSMLDSSVSEWRTVKIDVPDTFELIGRMLTAHQEPVVTATWLSHFLLCGQAGREGVRNLFGGLGGDELNAGEYEYFWHFFADLKVAGDEAKLEREIAGWVKYHDHPIFRKSREIVATTLPRMADLSHPGRCLADFERMLKYRKALNPAYYDLGEFRPLMLTPFRSYLKNRCYQDLSVETIPPCLRAEDRQGAYFGIENFLPFLDHRLVELMFQVDGTWKFREGVTKHILREAMKGVLPEETRTRVKKTGWNAPAHVWFSGKGRATLLDMIHSREFRERGLYDVAEIERLVNEHEEIVSKGLVKENHMMFLWQLLNLELWLRQS